MGDGSIDISMRGMDVDMVDIVRPGTDVGMCSTDIGTSSTDIDMGTGNADIGMSGTDVDTVGIGRASTDIGMGSIDVDVGGRGDIDMGSNDIGRDRHHDIGMGIGTDVDIGNESTDMGMVAILAANRCAAHRRVMARFDVVSRISWRRLQWDFLVAEGEDDYVRSTSALMEIGYAIIARMAVGDVRIMARFGDALVLGFEAYADHTAMRAIFGSCDDSFDEAYTGDGELYY